MGYTAAITGTGSFFPAQKLTNQDLVKNLDTSESWIVERTGIRERRISDLRRPEERNSSLAARAAEQALLMAGKKAEEIDQIIYATCTADTLIPSAACWLQQKINAHNAWVFDVNAACSGFLYALTLAEQAVSLGRAKTVLVIGADTLSPVTNWTDRTSCILFGDGAGAVIVEQSTTESRILGSCLQSDGRLWDLFHIPAGGSNQEVSPEVYEQKLHKMHMKGPEIFKIAVKTLADLGEAALRQCGLSIQDVTWVIPHQANLRIIEAVSKRLNVSMDHFIVNIETHGNTSSATIPTAFDEAVRDGRIKRGDIILMSTFGAGLTKGALVLRW